MFSCEANIVMTAPQRCLLRLCKHWSHKFQVRYSEHQGVIEFQSSICELNSIDDALRVRILTPVQSELVELQAIVVEHIQRMAGENLHVDWSY